MHVKTLLDLDLRKSQVYQRLLLVLVFTLGVTVSVQAQNAYTSAGLAVPTVSSDKADYAPGEIAIVTGTGWSLDSLVDIHLEEDPEHEHHHSYHDTKVNADGTWEIRYQIEERHLGVAFTVVVDGKQSGYQGLAYFTDGNLQFSDLSSANRFFSPTIENFTFTIKNNGSSSTGNAETNVKVTINSDPARILTIGTLGGGTTSAIQSWDGKDGNGQIVADGSYDAVVTSDSKAAGTSGSQAITITVDNTKPTLALISPVANVFVKGTINLHATATDANGVNRVEFYVDGTLVGTDNDATGGYTYSINTTILSNGNHTILAKAYDRAGNDSSTSQTIKVDNAAPAVAINTIADGLVNTVFNITGTASDLPSLVDYGIASVTLTITTGGITVLSFGAASTNNGFGNWSHNFTPTQAGEYVVTATATDKAGNSTTASSVSFTVIANTAPVAANDSYTTSEDNALIVTAAEGVLGNDTDAENDALATSLVTGPAHGTLTVNANGSFTYTPASNYNGNDSFTYKASDGQLYSTTATVNITVSAVNDVPAFAKGANETVLEDAGLQNVTNWATNISAGPSDEAGQTLAFTVTNNNNALFSSQPAMSAVGTLTYTPAPNANGVATVTIKITDNGGTANGGVDESAEQTFTITVTPVNDVPVAIAQAVTTDEDVSKAITLSGTDIEGDNLTYIVVDAPAHGTFSNGTYTPTTNYFGTDSFTFKANDGAADSEVATVSITVTPVNDAPVVASAIANVTVLEDAANTIVGLSNTFSDVDDVNLTINVSANSNTGLVTPVYNAATKELTLAYTADGNGSATIKVKATDAAGLFVEDEFIVSVTPVNDVPALNNFIVKVKSTGLEAVSPVSLTNAVVTASASLTDPDLGDVHSVTYTWGDGASENYSGVGITSISKDHTYATPGVYKVTLTVKDAANATVSDSYEYVVVYDPNGGFVTGGGWINSPAGAYVADASLEGKANFGFVAKYKKGSSIPDGNTEFQFQAGNMNFNSTSYDDMRLVIGGAKANYKGKGKINGAGDYGFMVTAIDGEVTGGGGVDKFRIKIWAGNDETAVVYDNQMGAGDDEVPTTALGGGSIVIHEVKTTTTTKTTKLTASATEPGTVQFYNYPNTFTDRTTIAFSLDKQERYTLEVYDMRGALIFVVKKGTAEAGKLYEYEFDGNSLSKGIYVARLVTPSGNRSIKMLLTK